MGQGWDGTGIAFSEELWTLVYRLLIPSGVVKAFSGTRTFHRLIAAMEGAGFVEVHLEALGYSSGFPKNLDVSKALDRQLGAERPVLTTVLARNPHAQATGWGNPGVDNWKDGHVGTHPMPVTGPGSAEAALWEGWGTALKLAWEPVLVGRKPG